MNNENCGQAMTSTKKDIFLSKVKNLKIDILSKLHSVWWTFLHKIGIGFHYSKLLCRANLYRKYIDGRCMWCGEVH